MSNEVSADNGPKRGRKSIVMIGGAIALFIVAAAGVWFSGILDHLGHRSTKPMTAMVEKPTLIDLPDIVSNLDTGGHRASFIKLHAKLQVAHATDAIALQAVTPQILDIFQTYLRSTRPDELRGGEGTYRLREALMNRIDATVAPVQLTDLLFTELLVQ